jgi:hypothetical protein
MITRDGLLEPTIDPDSNAGRIRSSIMEPERASLRYHEDVEGSLLKGIESDSPSIDFEYTIPGLPRHYVSQGRLP